MAMAIKPDKDIFEETLETEEIGGNTYYLDRRTDGRYSISRDEFILHTFNGADEDARDMFKHFIDKETLRIIGIDSE